MNAATKFKINFYFRSELAEVVKVNLRRLFHITFKQSLIKIAIFLCALTTVLLHQALTPKYVFVLIILYENLRVTLAVFLPRGFISMAETKISLKRIEDFLILNERKVKDTPKSRFTGIYTYNLQIRANSASCVPLVSEISFTAIKGEVVVLTGQVGSGKSTLLYSLMGENNLMEGNLDIRGSISYASQVPWIFSASIKENILFGSTFDNERYSKVIRVCALEHDLALLSHGDNTLVGDRGVMLSGGQKSRINLARAVYRIADIYLLDDPFSAVDDTVAVQIFNDCIRGFLEDKCVLLVTHQLQILTNVDHVYQIKDGKLYAGEVFECNFKKVKKAKIRPLKSHDIQSEVKENVDSSQGIASYKRYCLAGGNGLIFIMVLATFVFIQIIISFKDFFLAFWINVEQNLVSEKAKHFFTNIRCLFIYGTSLIILLILIFLGSALFLKFSTNASQKLHSRMFKRIMYGTMIFFNNHSSGRLLNRFAKDIGTIDENLPVLFMEVLQAGLFLIGIVTIICILNYWMIIPTILLMSVIFCFAKIFEPTNRSVKLTEAISKCVRNF